MLGGAIEAVGTQYLMALLRVLVVINDWQRRVAKFEVMAQNSFSGACTASGQQALQP